MLGFCRRLSSLFCNPQMGRRIRLFFEDENEDDHEENDYQESALTSIPAILHHSPHLLLTGYLVDFGGNRDIFQCDTERFK